MSTFTGYDDWKTTDPDLEGLVPCRECGEDMDPEGECECGASYPEPDYSFDYEPDFGDYREERPFR